MTPRMYRVIVGAGIALVSAGSLTLQGCGGLEETDSAASDHDADGGATRGFPKEGPDASDSGFPKEGTDASDSGFPKEGPDASDSGFPHEGPMMLDAGDGGEDDAAADG